MVFNATFNNILVISWRSVLLVEVTRVPRENHWPAASHWQLYHIMLYTSSWAGLKLTTLMVIGTDCMGSCKSKYQMITITTALIILKYENKACTQKFYDGGSLSVYNTTLKRCCHFFLQYKCCSMKCFHFSKTKIFK
jgi:hypothetical protein